MEFKSNFVKEADIVMVPTRPLDKKNPLNDKFKGFFVFRKSCCITPNEEY